MTTKILFYYFDVVKDTLLLISVYNKSSLTTNPSSFNSVLTIILALSLIISNFANIITLMSNKTLKLDLKTKFILSILILFCPAFVLNKVTKFKLKKNKIEDRISRMEKFEEVWEKLEVLESLEVEMKHWKALIRELRRNDVIFESFIQVRIK